MNQFLTLVAETRAAQTLAAENSSLVYAEWGLTAALVLIIVALICNLVILTSKRAKNLTKAVAEPVGAGVGSRATVTLPGQEGGTTVLEDEPARATQERGNLGRFATAFVAVAFVLVTIYVVVRMSVTGHGPFSNQHEFAISFTWGILGAYLIAEWRYKIRVLAMVVLPVAAAMLLYSMRINSDVEPLVPALQNKLLLTLHVGTAIIAYGAAMVSAAAAVIYLLHGRLSPKLKFLPSKELLDEIGYKASVITFPMLTMMNVLGAIWANIAWGRYWSWDPKETASFITWLIYGAYLHARVTRGWTGKRSAWLLIIGFGAVLFAYFGNYFLGGLHSYA